MSAYLGELTTYSVMSAHEELSHATRYFELRVDVWLAVLAHEPALSRARAAMETMAEETAPRHEDTRDTLARRLVRADPGQRLLEAIVAEIDQTSPPEPAEYRAEIRRARARAVSARNAIVCANLRFVIRLAKRYGREHLSLEDRVQEGNFGLLTAVDHFDHDRGFRFSTYAAWWIRHTITRALVNHSRGVRVPSHTHALYLKARKVRVQLGRELGRDATTEEVAQALDERPEKLVLAERAMEARFVALDASVSPHHPGRISDVIADGELPNLDDELDLRRNSAIADGAFHDLAEIERDILVHRFGLGGVDSCTLHGLGSRRGLSRERIRQLQNRALAKLRVVIEASPLCSSAVASS